MVHTIITHPGSAHKDDLLAVSILIALHGARVLRREPTQEELLDPSIAIVDVGGSHAPERSNFDHHHFGREHPPSSALSLLLEALGLYKDALQFYDWLEPAEWIDSRGPNKTADWLGVPRETMSQLSSPIDTALLRRFAAETELQAGEPLYEVMGFIGADLLDHLRIIREHIAAVAEHAERWSIAVGEEVIETIFLPRADPPGAEASDAVESYIRDQGLQDTIAAIVYPDRRGSGYGLGRYEDHPRLDFALVEDEPDVHFAHKTGFMCKTSATAPARLRELVAAAWISSPRELDEPG